MEFSETATFTKRVADLLDEESYVALMLDLMDRPSAGALIPQSGGLRKVRWANSGKGKRGGVRVIYLWLIADDHILFADIYAKNEKGNLSDQEIAKLRKELGL